MALRLGIVCDLFAYIFGNHSTLRNVQKPLFRWATVVFLSVGFSFAIYTHRLETDATQFAVHVLARSANIVLCGLILTLLLFSWYLGLSWSRAAFGIVLGIGILSSVELATTAIRSQFGHSGHVIIDMLTMVTYLCCVLIWLYCLVTPERRPSSIPDSVPDNDLESWNHELEGLLTR